MGFTDDEIRACERSEGTAWAEIVEACGSQPGNPLRAEVVYLGAQPVAVVAALDFALFNRVIGLGIFERDTDAAALVDVYRSRAQSNFSVALSPLVDDGVLAGLPVRRGTSFARVVRRPSDPPTVETDLRVEEVGANAADAFAAVNVAAWEVPPAFSGWFGGTLGRRDWHHWLAYDGDLPVSTGALFARDGVGWLGFGATLPSHRGRGGQGAIMAARIRKAAELGCSIVHTETDEETAAQPNPSYRNMLRTGFEVAYRRPNYLSAAVGE